MIRGILLTLDQLDQMRAHVDRLAPEEACGLVAGQAIEPVYQAIAIFPLTNVLHSASRYRLDPREQWQVFTQMEQQGQDLVAIYHSHPQGPPTPSATDIAEAYYPQAVYLLWHLQHQEWRCRAFLIQNDQVAEVKIFLESDLKGTFQQYPC